MNIKLKQISLNDDLDGLELLKEISNTTNDLYSSPVPSEINEYLYTGFLKLSFDEAKEKICFRYWVLLDNKKIGYSDIKILNNDNKKIGDIGIILSSNYRGKNIGYNTMKLLLKEAKEQLKVDSISIRTNINNIKMQKLCENLGATLTSKDEECHYIIN